MPITVDQFEAALAKREFASVYFFYGEEEFLVEESISALLEAAVDPATRGFNCDIVYGGDANADDIVALANAFPMMAERRVVLVREFEKLSGKEPAKGAAPDDVAFIRYVKQPSPTTVMILSAEEPDMRRSPYVQLGKSAVAVQCKRMYERDALKWIEGRAKRKGKQLGAEAARLLLAQVGVSLRTLSNEIDKLFVFTGERQTITEDDVRHVVGLSHESTIFELQKALGERRVADAWRICERLLVYEKPPFVITMLGRFYAQIHQTRAVIASGRTDRQAVAAQLKINPYFADEFIGYARSHSERQIDAAFLALRETDRLVKTSQTDAGVALHILMTKLLSADTGSPTQRAR